jgi:hypothetical protein
VTTLENLGTGVRKQNFAQMPTAIPGNDYADLFCQQSNDGVKRSVLGQIHSKSMAAEVKRFSLASKA